MGRKRRERKACSFRLYPETHEALMRLMEELELREVEQVLQLMILTFRSLLKVASQPEPSFPELCLSVLRHYEEVSGRTEPPEALKPLERVVLEKILTGGGE